MSERAEKSGVAEEAQRKIYDKFEAHVAEEILRWISGIVGDEGGEINTSGDVNNFLAMLQDGTVLCRLANELEPGAIKKFNTSTLAFKKMENISFFLTFAARYVSPMELFQTVDLYESQDPNAVLICLLALARKAEQAFGRPGVGPRESQKHTREWTREQLRAGEGVIGLQAGSNKGANQSGLIMGNTRHM